MDYKVVVTSDAEEDLDRFLQYLLFEKKNEPAAGNILDDFGDTLNCLKNVAGSLSLCENQRLRALGYHRINFLRHRYFMLYRIEENTVFNPFFYNLIRNLRVHIDHSTALFYGNQVPPCLSGRIIAFLNINICSRPKKLGASSCIFHMNRFLFPV